MSPNDPRHGTQAGRRAHQRAGEKVCESCREAFRKYSRGNEKRQREVAGLIDPDDAVLGGRGKWVPGKGGVQRWLPDPTVLRAAELKDGKKHANTTVCIDCGTDLESRAARCTECRAESDRIRWREAKRKRKQDAA